MNGHPSPSGYKGTLTEDSCRGPGRLRHKDAAAEEVEDNADEADEASTLRKQRGQAINGVSILLSLL